MTIQLGVDDLNALEDVFGIPKGYIESLQNEDDWSLIIKAHAILESACADMLTHYFRDHRLADIFAKLDMGDRRSGKAAFLSALELIGKKERGFITKLTSLRNIIVHNASNVTFCLHDYLLSLTPKELSDFANAINIKIEKIELIDSDTVTKTILGKDILLKCPKHVIWHSFTHCLSKIYIQNLFSVERNKFISEKLKERQTEGPKKLDHKKISIKKQER